MSSRPTLSAKLSGLPGRLKSNNGSRSSSPRPGTRSTMVDGKENCLHLRANIIRGRNLAAKDKSGTSDPYVVLTLGDSREATSAISKTLNPEWNQTFDLPIPGIEALVLEGICWDKDRFGKDYMGEFEIPLEDLFNKANVTPEPHWYALRSSRKGKKSSNVSGDVLVQFALVDPHNPSASADQLYEKLMTLSREADQELDAMDEFTLSRKDTDEMDEDAGEDGGQSGVGGSEDANEDDDAAAADDDDAAKKRKRRIRVSRMKRKARQQAGFEFTGESQVAGVLFLEISKIEDLPPEKNMLKTGFDMDPFVVTSLGKKTYRTRVVRHNLNPVYDEKLIFQVLNHEQNYSVNFTVMDRDRASGNDYVGTVNLDLKAVRSYCDDPDPETGLYKLPEIDEGAAEVPRQKRFKLPISRSSSAQSLQKITSRPGLRTEASTNSLRTEDADDLGGPSPPVQAPPTDKDRLAPTSVQQTSSAGGGVTSAPLDGLNNLNIQASDDPELRSYKLPLDLKNKEKWDSKHSPILYLRAKYMPYGALRQQFWRAMLKQYDADDSGQIDKIELTTMLDNLGATLHESTIDAFFQRFASINQAGQAGVPYMTMDQAVMSLEGFLEKQLASQDRSLRSSLKNALGMSTPGAGSPGTRTPLNQSSETTNIPAQETDVLGPPGEEGDHLNADTLHDEQGEEHLMDIRECPICHQPRMNKKTDSDIVTHVATCASSDWRQVNSIVMSGFVTSSQAQRKWYSKVVTKITYGGYKLGANSANTLVQDRLTGQINEEKMSMYVRMGIRLLYKGLKSRDMESRRIRSLLKSLSVKQGKKYDDPASASAIPGFIQFHQLNMQEVKLPVKDFKTFNEFFYRELKPNARPCTAPDRPEVAVSPADCRTVVFNTLDNATSIWVKGREFSLERLLGKAYPEDAKRYVGGSFGIFRLAPQDYHRFHIPVDGVMGEPKLIEGEYYTVNPMAIRSALDVYGENVRVLVPIDSEKHGRVMVVCVGAMMVGSTVITRKAGENVKRAEELGYFKFGGSTILLIFEPGKLVFDQDLVDNSNVPLETLVQVGTSIGHHPDSQAYTGDMKKDNPTNEEKQEAKRRIEGSLAPERGEAAFAAS